MYSTTFDPGSFRDPSGVVYKVSNNQRPSDFKIIRGINSQIHQQHKELLETKVFNDFQSQNKIIATRIIDPNEDILQHLTHLKWDGFLEHNRIKQISYPYEWSFSQLKDAALLHLELLIAFLENDWIIKDATPYNIQFVNNKPVFIDTPSIIKLEEGSGWDAYRQFCSLFLYPLMLESYLGINFRTLLKGNLDGIEPSFIYKMLGARKFYKKGVLSHVIFPHIVEKRILVREKNKIQAKNRSSFKQPKLSVLAMVDSMQSIVKKIKSKTTLSAWVEYDHINTYEEEDNLIKKAFIKTICQKDSFDTVWDLGSNTGIFSEHISENVNHIVAIDGDHLAVDKMYLRLRGSTSNINPLILDIQNMSPNHGFNSMERIKLEQRSPPDLVMCLAVIHHIRIASNIPCDNFLSYLRSLGCRVIIEFVNRDDEMVEKLLVNKKEKYIDYNLDSFIKSSEKYFTIKDSAEVKGGKRVLFYLEPK